ncbi:MAG: ImmA/IrrE family metallo-endopeptidase [Burkholderiales bacterium]|nr:ImmA/IrrE family metallo-endopeptidase [Burkholderiales bacterium]
MKETIFVNPAVLAWFGSFCGGIQDFAQSQSKSELGQQKILRGELTKTQAIALARSANKPVGFLLLDNPPQEVPISIPDLRTRHDTLPLNEDFRKIYLDAIYKQDWLIETRNQLGIEKLGFVGKFNISAKIKDIVTDMQSILKPPHPRTQTDIENYYKNLVGCAENAGILVLQNSCVINNTHRFLEPKQFLGFAVADKIAPMIFINTADKSKAKVFTLIHELAHLWLNASGISESYRSKNNPIETMCNKIAGEFLVPQDEFLALWKDVANPLQQIKNIGERFKVSHVVVAVVALVNNKIDEQVFNDIRNHYKSQDEKTTKGGSSNMQIAGIIKRSGNILTEMVNKRLAEGYIDYKDASMLLNIPINKVTRYVNRR